jgi:hypothetical protein
MKLACHNLEVVKEHVSWKTEGDIIKYIYIFNTDL